MIVQKKKKKKKTQIENNAQTQRYMEILICCQANSTNQERHVSFSFNILTYEPQLSTICKGSMLRPTEGKVERCRWRMYPRHH